MNKFNLSLFSLSIAYKTRKEEELIDEASF
jgi:hypothetical protein